MEYKKHYTDEELNEVVGGLSHILMNCQPLFI